MKPSVRYALLKKPDYDQDVINDLHSGTDCDSLFLSTVIRDPMSFHVACHLLYTEGSPLARLWAAAIEDGYPRPALVHVDHPLWFYVHPAADPILLAAARRFNDSLLYDLLLRRGRAIRDRDVLIDAVLAGSAYGMFYHAVYGTGISAAERAALYHTSLDENPVLEHITEIMYGNEEAYERGRILCAIGSNRRRALQSFYLDQRLRARRASITWMLCARALGLYKDVARLVGRLVYEDETVRYERKGIRSSKRVKK